jgi:hypothetical protein
MGMEPVPKTMYLNQLTWLITWEDYIELCRHECFKTYILLCRLIYKYTIFLTPTSLHTSMFCVLHSVFKTNHSVWKSKVCEQCYLTHYHHQFLGTSQAESVGFVASTCLFTCIRAIPRFSQNFIFATSTKICQNILHLLTTGQTQLILYIRPNQPIAHG